MTFYLALLLIAAGCALFITPLVTAASRALGLVDAPGGRKVHPTAVPRLGGVAICAAAALSATLVLTSLPPPWLAGATVWRPVLPILAGGALVLVVGLADDVAALPAWPKLAVHGIAAAIVAASGLLIERLTVAGVTWQLGLLAYPATIVWIVCLTNAFNLIDGVDGLAAGIAVIAGTTCAAILIGRGHMAEATLLVALVGAALGFLVYNFAPASVFLGDGGSLLFGFVLAATAITGWQKGATALAAGVPLLIFALPLADAASALLRRAFGRAQGDLPVVRRVLHRIVQPDRGHIHHRLLAAGWSTRRTVLALYGVTLLLSVLALATARYEP